MVYTYKWKYEEKDLFIDKKQRIYPILDLILYRVCSTDYNDLYSYDGMVMPRSNYKRNIRKKYRGVIKYYYNYLINRKKILKRDENKNNILFSDSIILSKRLTCLLEEVSLKCNIISWYRFEDERSLHGDEEIFKLRQKKKDQGKLYVGSSVQGDKIKTIVKDIYNAYTEIIVNNSKIEKNKLEVLYKKLNIAVDKRIKFLKKCLLKEGVEMFVTYNQCRIADLLIIMACNELNIWTKEIIHFLYFSRAYEHGYGTWNVREYSYRNLAMYVDESCQWCEAAAKAIIPVNKLGNNCVVSICGCPEITKKKLLCDYNSVIKKNEILFLVPEDYELEYEMSLENINMSFDEYRQYIYGEIKKCAKNNNVGIVVRCHPGTDEKRIKELEDNNFIISDCNSNINNIIAEYKYCIGGYTSALYLAKIYGASCYKFIHNMDEEGYAELGVKSIRIDEIENLKLQYEEARINDLWCREKCIDVNKVIEIPNK